MRQLGFVPIALALFAATALMADVLTEPPLSGNFALTVSGYELLTPSGSSSLHLDIDGEGLLTADGAGHLNGSETFTAANPAVPEPPSSTVAASCTGTLSGTINEPGDGTASIQLQFTPSSGTPAGVGAQDSCISTVMTLACVELFPQFGFVPPIEGAGGSPQPASGSKGKMHRHRRSGTNGAASGPGVNVQGGTGTAIPWPVFFAAGAEELKCVASSVTTTSAAASIDGALLKLNMRETPPASIVLPTPWPGPTPEPLSPTTRP
jgi:hypothetical protein